MSKPFHRRPMQYQFLPVKCVLPEEQRIFDDKHDVRPGGGGMSVEQLMRINQRSRGHTSHSGSGTSMRIIIPVAVKP